MDAPARARLRATLERGIVRHCNLEKGTVSFLSLTILTSVRIHGPPTHPEIPITGALSFSQEIHISDQLSWKATSTHYSPSQNQPRDRTFSPKASPYSHGQEKVTNRRSERGAECDRFSEPGHGSRSQTGPFGLRGGPATA